MPSDGDVRSGLHLVGTMKKEFGFYPEPLRIDAGPVSVRTLANLEAVVESLFASDEVEDGWIYAPPQQTRDFMSGEVRTRPYSARVFGLSKTHVIEHAAATGDDHLHFHIWVLSFFLGTRLTATEAGFLDGTPIKRGGLVDFVPCGKSVELAVELAEDFWKKNIAEPRNAQRFAAAVHALFLGQYRQALQFEEFIHLYAALDACYALTKALTGMKGASTHAQRIKWTCDQLGVGTPAWAISPGRRDTVVSGLRNKALHEALFVDQPLGFAVHGGGTGENLPLEMKALVCRLLVALIGGNDVRYFKSPVNTRQRQGLRLK